jgi:hypothetical protein
VGLAPSVDWLDAGSLTASAWGMGVAHPPGEPGWLVPARLVQLLPVGDIAFRANLLSAATVAACAAPLLWLTRAVVGERAPWGGAFACGLALLGYGARMQAERAEVYGLVALLLVAALAAAVCLQGLRASGAIGLLLGLAAGVHPLLAAAATPGLLVARALRSRVRPGDVLALGGFGAATFAVYAWLPLRARANPAKAWGLPDSPGRFVDVLLGRAFARNFGAEEGSVWANLGVIVERHALSGVLVAIVLGFLAAAILRNQSPDPDGPRASRRALAWAAPVWVAGNAMTILPQNKVFGSNPDVLGYLLVGTLAVAPLGGLGVSLVRSRAAGTPFARLGPVVLGAAALAVAWIGLDGTAASRTDNRLARTFATAQAQALPPGAVLLTSGNDTAFLWTYLQAVERRRPDVIAVHRVLLGHPHERIRLGPALQGLGVPWVPELQTRPTDVLSVADGVFVEARSQERALMGTRLHRHGLVWRLGAPADEGESLAALRADVLAALEGPQARGDEEAALVAALFHDVGRGAP